MKPNHKVCSFCPHWNDRTECGFKVKNILDCQLVVEEYEEDILNELMRR
jgi:hypothetical protein